MLGRDDVAAPRAAGARTPCTAAFTTSGSVPWGVVVP